MTCRRINDGVIKSLSTSGDSQSQERVGLGRGHGLLRGLLGGLGAGVVELEVLVRGQDGLLRGCGWRFTVGEILGSLPSSAPLLQQ